MQQYDNSLVSEAHRFVLWWHAKAGCTGLKVWYLRLFGCEPENVNGQWQANGQSVHERIHQWKNKYDPAQHAGSFHFTVLRHPLARLVSHWDQQTVDGGDKRSLEEYVRYVVTEPQETVDPHVARQWATLKDVPIHLAMRLESVNDHWPGLMRMLGLPEKPLPIINRRGAGETWEQVLTDPTVRLIAENHYHEDLAQWNKCR